jgi:hypothetical protein
MSAAAGPLADSLLTAKLVRYGTASILPVALSSVEFEVLTSGVCLEVKNFSFF